MFASGEHRLVRWSFRSSTLERSPFRQGIQRLREFVDSGLADLGKAIHFAPTCLANGNPPLLRIDEIGTVVPWQREMSGHQTASQGALVLAERIAFADRHFGGAEVFAESSSGEAAARAVKE